MFVVVGTIGPGIPVAIYFAMGERAAKLLDGAEGVDGRSTTRRSSTVLLLVIGAKLIGDGVTRPG